MNSNSKICPQINSNFKQFVPKWTPVPSNLSRKRECGLKRVKTHKVRTQKKAWDTWHSNQIPLQQQQQHTWGLLEHLLGASTLVHADANHRNTQKQAHNKKISGTHDTAATNSKYASISNRTRTTARTWKKSKRPNILFPMSESETK